MAGYDELIEQATDLRVRHHDAEAAIACYQRALKIGGPRDREAQHMAGVSYGMLRLYGDALGWYLRALDGASDYERGNIERDRAEAYSAFGLHSDAERSISTSLRLLPYTDYPAENAATQGFLARHLRRKGDLQGAIQQFAYADRLLHAGDNRDTELYNKLAYAGALAEAGHFVRSRQVAFAALKLTRHHGAPVHRRRALILIAAGHPCDRLFSRLSHR